MESPILVLGIAQRSGTNYLARVLECHQDCELPSPPLNEDHLLADGARLVDYATRVTRRWPPEWGDSTPVRAELEHHLGEALLRFLADQGDGPRVVSKTPSLEGIELIPRLVPGARLVVLVRDGRAVTASLMRGFHFSLDRAARNWRAGARALLRFQKEQHPTDLLVVRYEDLLDDFDQEVERVLDYCKLDPAGFDIEQARSLPVTGSSFDRPAHGKLTWDPVERRSDTFDPTARHRSWSPATQARFDWLAGREQEALGYERTAVRGNRLPWLASNLGLDACWPARAAARSLFDRAWLRFLRARQARRGGG